MHQAASTAPITFQERSVEVDGFSIKCREAGSGESVVVLDSITWGFSDLHTALAQHYRVTALELPGFGSAPVNSRSTSAKDLAETTVHAASAVGLEQYSLIGSSFGGNVALWHALLAPERVEALVLVSPTALLPTGNPVANDASEMGARLLAHPENSAGLPASDLEIAAKERELVHRLGGETHDAEAESRLSEIQCATLVVFGSQDKLVSPEAARIYRRDIPNCNVSIVYDTGHLILAERPQALINAVVDYVERRETFVVSRDSRLINP